MVQLLWDMVWPVLKRLNVEVSNYLAVLPLGVQQEELKTVTHECAWRECS